MEEETLYPPDSDLDFSFTSCASTTTTNTTNSLSARSSLARSSLCLSFNESRLSSTCSTTTIPNFHQRPHRSNDPQWSAIKTATNLSSDATLHISHLKLLRHLGTGDLGRVFLCRLRDNDHANFALKVIDHDSLSSKKFSNVQTESEILSILDHPFLPTLYAHLQVSHYTCLLIDFCSNGDLHSLQRKQPSQRFPIHAVKFYAAEVLLALEYLHALGIVYRDLKPENILIREDGHIMLSDFDLCFKSDVEPKLENFTKKSGRKNQSTRNCVFTNAKRLTTEITEFVAEPTSAFTRSCVGTHEYLAPEIISGNGYGNGVDWWAFGVLLYELLYGKTPFKGRSKECTLRNIAATKGVKFHVETREEEEKGMREARDLIERLLVKDPRKRLGCARGATDIKLHPFFNGIKWPLIRTYRPPEVRGIVVKKSRTHMSHVTGGGSYSKKRRCLWKRLGHYLMKTKVSKYNLNSNSNYHCHSSNSKARKYV